MAITKFIKRQDSGFKLSEGNSGESSLNLSNEIFELLCPESIEAGKEKEITFKIFKDDFIKAICFIISKLPLYRSSSNSSIKVDYDYEVFKELQDNVESMFGPNKEADYTCTLLHRSDGRKYLKGLKVNGFSIRNYLVENLSALEFDNIGGSKSIRLLSNITEDMEPTEIKVENKLILSETKMTQFVYNCVSYFSENSDLWGKIDNYVSDAKSIKEGDSIKICKEGVFSLVGMFKCTTEDNIINFNTPRRRWFSEPFTSVGKTVFLSTEWYPGMRDNGTAYSLMMPEFAAFVSVCFGEEYQCVNNNGTWELWHKVKSEKTLDNVNYTNSNPRVWIYAPGEQARLWDACQQQSLMRLGWDELGDYHQFDSRQAVIAKMKEVYEVDNKSNDALAVWQFLNDMQIGDIVYAKKGTYHIIGRGVVEADYVYDDSLDEFKNTRRIRWTETGNWEAPFRLPQKTLTRLYADDSNIDLLNKMIDGTLKTEVPSEPFSIKKMIGYIEETGLLYTDSLVKRFAFSLMSKRFLILSGLAGSGKTQLALAFASALVKNKDEQMCVVSVGADWTNREPLLGFPNALQPGKYVKPESGVLDLLIEANRPENADKPFFLILDEMNMSYVERYFADFLSAMESKEPISLWSIDETKDENAEVDGVPQKVALPKNLFIIGTINVDETTYMFSPKVLDRANVIEFKISPKEMAGFLKDMKEIDRENINGKAAGMGASFVQIASSKELAKNTDAVSTLQNFFNELKGVNAEFGYRSATEIFRFICQAKGNDDATPKLTDAEILDAAIVQKLLPKLHGSRKKLEPVLSQLWKLCFTGAGKDLNISKENVEKAEFKESADKIRRMYESATANGFTSFAEA